MSQTNISGSKQRKIKAVFGNIVSSKLATLDGEEGDRLLSKLELLRESIEPFIIGVLDKHSRLVLPKLKLVKSNVSLGPVESHDPNAFFKTRPGLFVTDWFECLFLWEAKPVTNLGPVSLSLYEQTEDMSDENARDELPKNHVFEDPSELCARLEQMISKQWNGEKGDLPNDGSEIRFHVSYGGAFVRRDVFNKRWFVGAFNHRVGGWIKGTRVFSRN